MTRALALTATLAALTAAASILGRYLRRRDDVMALADVVTEALAVEKERDVRAAAFERIGQFGIHDEEEWGLELLHSDGDHDGLTYAAAWMAMSARPMPEFKGEDHL